MPGRFRETPHSRIWDLTGLRVNQIIIDPGHVRLVLRSGMSGENDAIEVNLVNVFTVLDDKGTSHQVDPAPPGTLEAILALRDAAVHALEVGQDGSLVLSLGEGAEVRVLKDANYESWNTVGSGALSMASMLCSPHKGSPWGE